MPAVYERVSFKNSIKRSLCSNEVGDCGQTATLVTPTCYDRARTPFSSV